MSKERGSKMAKSTTNSPKPTWRRRLDMEILALRQVISLLQEVRSSSSSIHLLHEFQLLQHQLSISHLETCEATINQLKMELQSNVEQARRRIVRDFTKMVYFNEYISMDAGRFYRELGKQSIQITFAL